MPRVNGDDALPDNWNPMEEEYESSASELLHYYKLYVRKIPPQLNQAGVENTFKPYGAVTNTFLNNDPQRRYAMVTFADARDAERAIHGLHKKAPLNLNVEYAKNKEWYNQRKTDHHGYGKQRSGGAPRSAASDDGRRRELADQGSVSSSGRRQNGVGSSRQDWFRTNHSFSNGDDEDLGEYLSDEETYDALELIDDGGLDLNPGARMEYLLEELANTKVQLVRAQMREKAASLGLNGGRKSLPAGFGKRSFKMSGGRIVRQVSATPNSGPRLPGRETADLADDDNDQVPELREHVCVRCGHRGEMHCGACGTTYCSAVCQHKDWTARHASVCHNLVDSAANLARAGPRVAFQKPRLPRKPATTSAEVHEASSSNTNHDGHKRSTIPKRFASSNMHAKRPQRNDDGNQQWQHRQNRSNRRGNNNADTSGGETFTNQQHQNSNANFYSGGNNKSRGANADSKLNPVPIRRPWEKPAQKEADDWDNGRGRQLDQAKAVDAKPKLESRVFSASPRLPRTATEEPAKEPSKKTEKGDLLRPDGFVGLHVAPGAVLTLSLEADAATCDVDASYGRAVCVAVAEQFATQFEALCGDEFTKQCEASEICTASPGSYVAVRDALDGAWYRARVLTETRVALVDAARLTDVTRVDVGSVRRLPAGFLRTPEFSCVVGAGSDVDLKVGESYECVVEDVSPKGVCSGTLRSLVHAGGANLGPVVLRRWRCRAEDVLEKADPAALQAETPAKPAQAPTTSAQAKETVTEPKASPATEAASIPADSVDAILARPPVLDGSKVLLVEYVDSGRVFVRRADQDSRLEFDSLVQDVAVYGLDAPALAEPQPVGGVVVAQFTDGNYYRAIIRKRNRVEQSKYMLEYVEYGNTEISNLDKLRACPDELSLETRPALLSRVTLADVTSDEGKAVKFNEDCSGYLGELKDKEVELVLTLKDASSKGSVGCEASLCVERSKERVNEKLRRMLMPQWEVMEAKGEDSTESPTLMWADMKVEQLPEGPCRLQVLDTSTLLAGAFSACSADEDWRRGVVELSEELEKYAGSKVGSASYLPRQNELCVAKSEDGAWHRAACVEHPGGAGASHVTVLLVDSGRVESVAVGDVRKMLPETARRPAMAAYCAIEGYPEESSSNELLARTRQLLGARKVSSFGGIVDCSNANPTSEGEYSVVLPAVVAALTAEGLLKM